jgi:diguanylate cyclase (GGDEF)-like protein
MNVLNEITERIGQFLAARADDVRHEWQGLDTDALAMRMAGAVFFFGGALSWLALSVLPESWADSRYDWRISALAIAIGVVGPLLPWSRWPRRTQIAYALAALVIVAVGGESFGGPITPYLALVPLPFVFVGFTQPPGTSLVLMPFTAVALTVAAHGHWTHEFVGSILLAIPLAVAVGEAIAQMMKRQRDAEARVARLLDAVRVLAREDDARHGGQVIASLAVELLEADAAAVLVGNGTNLRRYQHRAWFGHPALADAVPYVVDEAELRESVPPGVLRFYQDASVSPLLAPHGHRARSALVVSLPGERRAVGVLFVLWGTRRRLLPTATRQAADLLAQEAGRMLQRLHQTAMLTHDAETDPLTQLANRRTYNRALATLQPGDAIVIVDLDHFKSVNDRFGHDEGDRTLRVLARCLRGVARQVDCVARYGGEEFALVLADAHEDGARAAMQRLRAAWQATAPVTSFSAGIAVHAAHTTPHQTLLRADAALYRAKADGRDRDEIALQHELVLP